MWTVIVAVSLLALAASNVLLFAMFGELTSRLEKSGVVDAGGPWVEPLTELPVGREPSDWPEPIADVARADSALLLVLSSTCHTCEHVASQLAGASAGDGIRDQRLAIVSVCDRRAAGQEFLRRHDLQAVPHFVDETGAWIKEALGVNRSPVALSLRAGRLEAGYSFGDLAGLKSLLGKQPAPAAATAVEVNGREAEARVTG